MSFRKNAAAKDIHFLRTIQVRSKDIADLHTDCRELNMQAVTEACIRQTKTKRRGRANTLEKETGSVDIRHFEGFTPKMESMDPKILTSIYRYNSVLHKIPYTTDLRHTVIPQLPIKLQIPAKLGKITRHKSIYIAKGNNHELIREIFVDGHCYLESSSKQRADICWLQWFPPK